MSATGNAWLSSRVVKCSRFLMMMAAAAPRKPINTLRTNTIVLSVKCFFTNRLNRAIAYNHLLFFIGQTQGGKDTFL